MAISDIPILSMLRTRMEWHQQRQKVLSENVANSDTPGYRPRDLTQPDFSGTEIVGAAPVQVAQTDGSHLSLSGGGSGQFRSKGYGSFEIRPAGNGVSIEDQMMKVANNQMDYAAATALYTRSLNLLKTALGKR